MDATATDPSTPVIKPPPPVPRILLYHHGYVLNDQERADYHRHGRELYAVATAGIEASQMPLFHAAMLTLQVAPGAERRTLLELMTAAGKLVRNAANVARRGEPSEEPLNLEQRRMVASTVLGFCASAFYPVTDPDLKLAQGE